MDKKFLLLLIFAVSLTVSAQKKLPTNIGDAFVLEFSAPFERIIIQTEEKNMPNRDSAEIFTTPQTKLKNHKGKPVSPNEIRAGMDVEIEIDKTDMTRLAAKEIKIRTDPDKRAEDIDGYLDRVEDSRAMIDGRIVEFAPNAVLLGTKEWKGKSFKSFQEIPLGSLVDLKGLRQANRVILITRGEVRPNLFTQTEGKLVEAVKKGLVLPSPGQTGAGVVINGRTFKVSQDLEINTYVNKVGNRIVPKFLRLLPEDDPNKVLFRFYVLEDDIPNAVAFSDGSVFVNTGLLKLLENEAQFAVILGHEIAHVTNEHARRRFEAQQDMAIWAALIGAGAGVAGQATGVLVAQLTYKLMSNKFSRDMEDQADRVGLYYAYDAGYDVRESVNLWRRVMGIYRESVIGTTLYIDHPALLERLKETRREVVLNYANADFREAVVGRDEFLKGVGYYFGWLERPKPVVAAKTTPTNPKRTRVKKNPVAVGDGFTAFFREFKKAVIGSNRAAVKNMMASNFEWALDGYVSRDEAFGMLDETLWKGLKNAVLRAPVKCKSPYCNNRAGYRVWSSARYKVEIMFEKDASGNWHWTALLGD